MHREAAQISRMENWPMKGWNLAPPSEKWERSPVIPHSLTISSSLLPSFPLCSPFVSSRQWAPWLPREVSMGELLYSSRWCILFWVFMHYVISSILPFHLCCCFCTSPVPLPPWWPCVTGPCTSGAGRGAPPSLVVPPLPRRFGELGT